MGRRTILPDAPGVQLPRGSFPSPQTYWSILQGISKISSPCLAALEKEQTQCTSEVRDFSHQMSQWQRTVGAFPIASLIGSILQSKMRDPHWANEIISHLLELVVIGLVTLVDKQKTPLSVNQWLALDPQSVLYRIRCRPEWSPTEQERRVLSYLELIHQCSQVTYGVIPTLQDPIRARMAHKRLPYDVYLRLLEDLSIRDRRIIELLYFGAPSVESVLALKARDVDFKRRAITFEDETVAFPPHVMFNLERYMEETPSRVEIFKNSKGLPVDRAHLNRCLTRAREKWPEEPLTIANLLR